MKNNNNNNYILLYYVCFIVSLSAIYLTLIMSDETIYSFLINLMIILNAIFVIINSIGFIIKTKYNFKSIIMPMSYLIFTFVIGILSVMYNKYVVVSYMHLSHFFSFVVVYYLLLNIYTVLCVEKKKEKFTIAEKLKNNKNKILRKIKK